MDQPRTSTERVTVEGAHLAQKVRELIHQGNVRHIVIKHAGHTVVEVPVNLAIAEVALAPVLAAVAAIGAVVTHCEIEVTQAPQPPS